MKPWWEDQYGMINARPEGQPGGGNKPLYSAIYCALTDAVHHDISWRQKFSALAAKHELEPGLFTRDPGNTQRQETWDNILGWISIGTIGWLSDIPHRIFWRGVFRLGFFDTDMKLSGEDWLWKHAHIWPLAFAGGHRWAAIFTWPHHRFFAMFLNADPSNPGGVMLDWLWFYSWHKLGFTHPKFIERTKQLPTALRDQVDPDHPMVFMAITYASTIAV